MKITRPDLAAMAVCVVALVGIVLLSALHVAIPEVVPTIALIALSAGVGVAAQTLTPPSVPEVLSEAVAAVAAPAPVVIPTQTTVADAPVATHAPA